MNLTVSRWVRGSDPLFETLASSCSTDNTRVQSDSHHLRVRVTIGRTSRTTRLGSSVETFLVKGLKVAFEDVEPVFAIRRTRALGIKLTLSAILVSWTTGPTRWSLLVLRD